MSISSFLQDLWKEFNDGDPEVATWFLVRSNYSPLILCGLYLLIVKVIGPAFMRNRKPFEFRLLMVVFNFLLVATYTFCVGNIIYASFYIHREKLCGLVNASTQDGIYMIASTIWMMYILKYFEFFDTIFFVLRKKENMITNLHVSHHTIVPLVFWIVLRTERSAFQVYPALINSVVHIIMYSYYGLAAIGPSMRKYLWWKRHLTVIQMVQFVMIAVLITVVMPLRGCTLAKYSIILNMFCAILFFILFYNYYRKSFMTKASAKISAD